MKNLKTKLLIVFTLLITLSTFAQQGINYKAIIKDGSGNVVANQLIVVQFSILKGVAETNVYQEQHTPITDTNGLVVLNIGQGTLISGDFIAIDWASDYHSLNVQVNTGSGLVDLGTTQFMTVPYAYSAANVTGLETLDEGGGSGWRLKGRNPANYGNIGLDAVDLSLSLAASTINGATGYASTAFGNFTKAESVAATAIGSNNIGGGSAESWVTTDPLFEVGNSNISTLPSNALTILKNGTITAPSFDLTEITTAGAKSLTTKEYVDANLATGLETLDEGNGLGWRLKGRNPANYGNIGLGAIDLSNSDYGSTTRGATGDYSTAIGVYAKASGIYSIAIGNITKASGSTSIAMGNYTTASGDYSIAMGDNTTASGNYSTAMGYYTTASGSYSTAMGWSTTASGSQSTVMGRNTTASNYFSIAMGYFTTASGYSSTAMGIHTKAEAEVVTAIGRYNIGGGDANNWVTTDPLFEIGNGVSDTSLSNALTVLKNGNVGIDTATPKVKLQVTGGTDASLTNGSGYFMIGSQSSTNIIMDNNEIIARNNGVPSALYLQQEGSFVEIGRGGAESADLRVNGDILVYGSTVHSSDRRLKKDIETLTYGLKEVLQLQPKAYNWKNREQTYKSFGLIAQEVQPIIKEIVHTKSKDDDTLSLSYTELIPVLIKAIQEQQEVINNQQEQISNQGSKIESQNNNYTALLKRIEQLENTNNTKKIANRN